MTLSRIARSLGLSIATVSRALGGFDDVSPKTRARVLEEAARINYRPSQIARRLRSGLTGAIGIVLPAAPGQFDDPFFLRMIAAIGPRLDDAGLDLLVTAARPGADELRTYRHLVEAKRVDGLFVCRTRHHDDRIAYLLDTGTPFVAHGRTAEERPYAHVDGDGESDFRAATERLIAFGHHRIIMINALDTYMFAHHRANGFRAAIRAASLGDAEILNVEPTEENGYRLVAAALARAVPPTAILCATDRLAVGALHAIASAGLRAGRDVSVIGHDDLPLASYTDPPLTTFEQSIEHGASRMVEMLLALLDGEDPAQFAEIFRTTLRARSSDGPAPAPAPGLPGRREQELGETHEPPIVPESGPHRG